VSSVVVDAHQHFWQVAAQAQDWRTPAHGAIARDYAPADLGPELARAGVQHTVLMQSVDTPDENDRLARYARAAGFVAGVVGWLPLRDPAAARVELERAADGGWCGARMLVGREPLDWLRRPDVVALFRELAARALAWDVVPVTAEQVAEVVRLAHAVPELRVVVDHLARPPLDTGVREPWWSNVADLGECPGVAMKVSVGIDLLTAWPWDPQGLQPYVDHVLDAFGAGRVMLASNWPVVALRSGYAQAWRDLSAAVAAAGLDPDDAEVHGGTARRWYSLDSTRAWLEGQRR